MSKKDIILLNSLKKEKTIEDNNRHEKYQDIYKANEDDAFEIIGRLENLKGKF